MISKTPILSRGTVPLRHTYLKDLIVSVGSAKDIQKIVQHNTAHLRPSEGECAFMLDCLKWVEGGIANDFV